MRVGGDDKKKDLDAEPLSALREFLQSRLEWRIEGLVFSSWKTKQDLKCHR